jgi:hypothetical protein
MNLFDCLLVAILAYSTIIAFVRGIILELFSLGGLVAGILVASWNYNHVAVVLGHLITTPATVQIVAFLLFPCGGSCGILRCTSRPSAADSEWRTATQAQRARLDQTAPVEAQ